MTERTMLVRPRPLLTVWQDWAVLILALALLAGLGLRLREHALRAREAAEISRKQEQEQKYTFTVPLLVGLPSAEARARLGPQTVIRPVRFVPSDKPRGVVVGQDPPPNTSFRGAKAHRKQVEGVVLAVSKGPKIVTPPKLRPGESGNTLARRLSKLGLKVVPQSRVDPQTPEGTVLGTKPPLGAALPAGSAVLIFVSSGIAPGKLMLESPAEGRYRLRYKPASGSTHRLLVLWRDTYVDPSKKADPVQRFGNGEGKPVAWAGGQEYDYVLTFHGYHRASGRLQVELLDSGDGGTPHAKEIDRHGAPKDIPRIEDTDPTQASGGAPGPDMKGPTQSQGPGPNDKPVNAPDSKDNGPASVPGAAG